MAGNMDFTIFTIYFPLLHGCTLQARQSQWNPWNQLMPAHDGIWNPLDTWPRLTADGWPLWALVTAYCVVTMHAMAWVTPCHGFLYCTRYNAMPLNCNAVHGLLHGTRVLHRTDNAMECKHKFCRSSWSDNSMLYLSKRTSTCLCSTVFDNNLSNAKKEIRNHSVPG